MNTLSPEQRETTRKGLTFLFQQLSSMGGEQVAEALGVSEATLSRIKNEDLERCLNLISILAGKVVPFIARCYTPETIEPLLQLAKQRMAQLDNVKQLEWDE